MKDFNPSVSSDNKQHEIIAPENRTFDVLEKLVLSEKIDYFYNMNGLEVEQNLIDLGISTTPSDILLKRLDKYKPSPPSALKI